MRQAGVGANRDKREPSEWSSTTRSLMSTDREYRQFLRLIIFNEPLKSYQMDLNAFFQIHLDHVLKFLY